MDAVSRSPPIPQSVLITKRPSSEAAPSEIRLEQTIDETDGEGDVCEEIVDAYPGFLGNDLAISLGHGFEHPEVELVVEMVHGPVEGLQGIGNPYLLLLPLVLDVIENLLIGDAPYRRVSSAFLRISQTPAGVMRLPFLL